MTTAHTKLLIRTVVLCHLLSTSNPFLSHHVPLVMYLFHRAKAKINRKEPNASLSILLFEPYKLIITLIAITTCESFIKNNLTLDGYPG